MSEITRRKYVVEHGIDIPGEGRTCAVETGQYLTKWGATRAAQRSIGMSAERLLKTGRNATTYDAHDRDMHRPIVGATVNAYSDAYGTDYDKTFDIEKRKGKTS